MFLHSFSKLFEGCPLSKACSLSWETFHSQLFSAADITVTTIGRKETSGTWSDTQLHLFPPPNIHLFFFLFISSNRNFPPHTGGSPLTTPVIHPAQGIHQNHSITYVTWPLLFPILAGAYNSCHLVPQNSFMCNSLIHILL